MSRYSTSDINVGAFLIAKGFPLVAVESARGSSRRGVMYFSPEAREVAAEYFTGGLVAAQAFTSALRQLKGQIRHELHNT